MNRSEFLDRAIVLYVPRTSNGEGAVKKAVELLELRDAAQAVVCPEEAFDCNAYPPEPAEGESRELGGAGTPFTLDPDSEV